MKNTRWTILAALVLAASSAAHAQGPAMSSAPMRAPMGGAPMGGAPAGGAAVGGASADSGAVTNLDSTLTTTTTTSSSGIGADGASVTMDAGSDTTALANTGGEPVLMSLIGLSVALGAFAIRKRVSA